MQACMRTCIKVVVHDNMQQRGTAAGLILEGGGAMCRPMTSWVECEDFSSSVVEIVGTVGHIMQYLQAVQLRGVGGRYKSMNDGSS
jgi:hypothetical protein